MVTIEHLKSDLAELMPELDSWPEELQSVQPLPEEAIDLAIKVRDEARRWIAELDTRGTNPLTAIVSNCAIAVRNIERMYDAVKPFVLTELGKGVELLDT